MCIFTRDKEARDIQSCYDHNPAFNLCKKKRRKKEVNLLKKYLCIEIQTNLNRYAYFVSHKIDIMS